MAHIHGLRHLDKRSALRRRLTHVPGRKGFLALFGLLVAAAVAAVAAALIPGDTSHRAVHAPFVSRALGRPAPHAPLVRTPTAGVRVALGAKGFSVSQRTRHAQRIELVDARSTAPWQSYANGVHRPTPFGHETVLVTRSKVEQYLTVERRLGAKTWSWDLKTLNLEPRVGSDGSIGFLDGHVLSSTSIAPPKIYDPAGHDITPPGTQWILQGRKLSLIVNDANLPTPYVIDPAITYRSSTYTGNVGTSIVLNVPAGARIGDVLVAQVASRSTAATITKPNATWTQVGTTQTNVSVEEGAFYHQVASGDPASWTFTLSASAEWAAGLIDLAGVKGSAPLNITGTANKVTSTTVTDTALAGVAANSLDLSLFALASGAATLNYTTPAATTFLNQTQSTSVTLANRVSIAAASFFQAAAGASTARATTCTNCTSARNFGWQISWAIDTTVPTAPTITSPGNYVRGAAVTLQGSATEADSALDLVFQRSPAGAGTWTTINTATTSPYQVSWDTTAVADGFYDLRVVARNGAWSVAGDDAPSSTVTVRVDNSSVNSNPLTLQALSGTTFQYFDSVNNYQWYNPSSTTGGAGSFTLTAAPQDVSPAISLVQQASSGGSPSGTQGTTGPLQVALPLAPNVGDVMIASVSYETGTNATITAPAGWVLLGTQNLTTFWGMKVYYKIAAAGDVTTHTYTWTNTASANANLAGGISEWSGVYVPPSGNPIDQWSSGTATSGTTTITAPSITPTADCELLLDASGAWSSQESFTPPAGMTEIYDNRSNEPQWDPGAELAAQYLGSAAATGNKTATLVAGGATTGGDKSNAGFLIALRPSACVSQVDFPAVALTGFAGTATSPVVPGAIATYPARPTYASNTYSWTTANTTEPGSQPIVSHDEAGNANLSTPFYILKDTTAPSFGASTPTAGGAYNTFTGIPVTAIAGATDTGDAGTPPGSTGSGVNATTYQVQRQAGTAANGVCTYAGGWTNVTLVGGNDTVPSVGCYHYREAVTDNVGNTGFSNASGDVIVDQTNPSSAGTISISESNASTYVPAGTPSQLFYRPAGAGGNFTVTDTSPIDAHSGIGKVRFPGLTGGFTPTTNTDDPSTPYAQTYAVAAAATDSGNKTVTVFDAAGNSVTTPFTLTPDANAPTSATTTPAANAKFRAATYTTAWSGTAADGVSESGLSGVALSLKDPAGNYWNGSVFSGASESFNNATGTSAWTWTAPALTTNGTYTVHVVATDNVGNVETSSTFTFVYDTNAPTFGTLAMTKSGNCDANVYLTSTSVYYNPATICANAFTMTQPLNDTGGSGPAMVGFPAIASGSFSHSVDTVATPFTSSAYGWSAAGAAYGAAAQTQTLTGTDGAGNTATTTFTIQKDVGGATTAFTAPAAASFIKNGATLSGTADDGVGNAGIKQVEFRYCAGATCTYASSTAIGTVAAPGPYQTTWNSQPADGQYTLLMRSTDNVGNVTDVTRTLSIDNTAPAFSSAAADAPGTHVTVTFTEAGSGLDSTSTTPVSAFTVLRNGSADAVTAVTWVDATHVKLTLTTRIFDPDTLTVAYSTASLTAAQQEKDIAGNSVASFGAQTASTSGAPSPALTAVAAAPSSITANGSTTSTITVTLKNNAGTNVGTSGGTVTLATTAGSLGSVTDNANGTYTATLTSSTSAGTATVSAKVDGTSVTATAPVTFTAGAVSSTQSTVTSSPGSVLADGVTTSTITVTAKDAFGNTIGGQTVSLAQGGGTSTVSPASASTNGSGVATFTVKATTAQTDTYTATIGATGILQSAQVIFTPGAATHFTVSAPASTTAGAPFSVTVTALDVNNNTSTGYTGTVHFTSNDVNSPTLPTNYTFVAGDNGAHTFANGVALKTQGSKTVVATDTVTGSVTGTASVTVNPAGAATLTVAGPANATAGTSFNTLVVTAKDAYGNTATGYTGTVTFSGGGTAPTFPANYTFVAGDNGTHTFTAMLTQAGARTITATDTVTGTITGSSGTITVAAANATTLALTTTAGSPQTAGVAFSTTITAKDAYGNTAPSYTGGVHFTSSDAQAASGSGLPNDYTFVAGDNGTHTFTNGTTLKTAGGRTITATDTVLGTITGTTSSITIAPAAAATLTVATTAGSPQTAGGTFSTTLTAKDAYGNVATGYTGIVHFTSTDPGSPTLPANYTFTGGDAGVHTFTNGVALKTVGPQSVTATDTVTGTITGTSSSVTVAPASAATLTVTGPANATAGSSFSSLVVTAKDAYGNTATGYTGTVTFSGGGTSPTLPGNYTFAPGDNGTHTFTATLTQSGARTITATDTVTGTITGSTGTITVAPVSAATLTVTGPANATAGSSFSNLVVTAKDVYGNVATGYTGTVTFSGGGTGPTLPANYTFLAGDNGTHTFTATLTQSGNRTITATDTVTGSITGTTGTIAVAPAGATTLTVTGPANATAGSSFNNLVVTAKDAYGNVATGYTGTVHFTGGGTSPTFPANYTFLAGDSGTHTFTATLTQAGSQTITATDTVTGTITGTTGAVAVAPAVATTLAVTGPANATAGTSFNNLVVTAKDAYGNTATGYTGTVHFTGGGTGATLPGNYTFAAGDNGAHTFTATLTQAGGRTITATDTVTATITGTSGAINVIAAAATTLTATGPSNATAGSSFNTLVVTAKDAYSNTAVSYTGTVTFSGGGTSPTLPANYTFVAGDNGTHTFAATLTQAGSRTITATDTVTGSINGTTGSIAVGAAGAATLTVTGPANATAGTAFNSLVVTAKDAYGNTATGYTGTVQFTGGGTSPTFPANYTFLAGDNGTHTFTATLTQAGSRAITATDTVTGTITGTTGTITVAPAGATTLTVTGPANATAGTSFNNLVVTAKDAYGNTATGYTGTVTFSGGGTSPTLPGNYAFTGGDNGTHTFTATLTQAGARTIAATDTVTGTITGTTATITVAPASAARLKLTGAATQTAGAAQAVTITAYDAYGNVATGYTGAHAITFNGASGSLSPVTLPTVTNSTAAAVTLGTPTTLTFTAGASTVGGSMKLYAAESATVVASAGDGGAGGTTTINAAGADALAVTVAPAAFSKLAFQLTSPQTNGQAFTGTNTLTAEDAYGNTVTSFNAFADNVTITRNAPLTGVVTGIHAGNVLNAPADFLNGVADLTSLGLTYTGNAAAASFLATATSGPAGTSNAVTVNPAAATRFVVTGSAGQTAGQAQTVTVTAVDGSGNTATSYTGDHAVTFTGAGSSPSPATVPTVTDKTASPVAFGSPATLSFAAGVATSGGSVVLYKAETANLVATAGAVTTTGADRLTVAVAAAPVSSLELAPVTSTPTAGNADNLTITARDPFGNVATSYTGDKSLTFGGAGSSPAPVTAPTVSDKTGTARAFGAATTITFANGVAAVSGGNNGALTLYKAEAPLVTVTDGSHSNGAGTSFTVSSSTASKLAILSVNGGSSPTAGGGFPVVVGARDAYGNASAVTADTGFTLSRATGTGTLAGTVSGTITNGQTQATLAAVTYTKAEFGVSLTATRTSGNALTAATSSTFSVSSIADRLVVSSANGGSNPIAGTPFSVTVDAQDGSGNPGNVTVDTTVVLTLATGTGALGGTLTATITAGQSQATVSGVTYSKAQTGVSLTATRTLGDALLAGTSPTFVVDPGAAARFVVAGSATQTAGNPNQLTITAYDANGNVATGYAGDHDLTFSGAASIGGNVPTATTNTGSATAFGSATTITFTNGVSTAGASMKLYRAQSATIVASAGDGGSGGNSAITTSSPDRLGVVVSPASTSGFVVTTSTGSQVAGAAADVTVTARDPYGNTTPAYTGTVDVSSNDPQADVPAQYQFTAGDAGVHTFPGGLTLKTAGSRTVIATDHTTGSITGTSAVVSVTAAALDHFNVSNNAAPMQTAGTPFDLTVTAKDAFGNTKTTYAGTADLTSNDGQAVLPSSYVFTGGDNGSHTFTGGVTLKTAGAKSVTATDHTATSVTGSTSVTVGPAAASTLTVTTGAGSPQTAGVAFGTTVTAKDAYGNTATGYTGAVHFTSPDVQAMLPANFTFAAGDLGTHSFAGAITLKTAGAQSVSATDTVTASINGTSAVTVAAAAVSASHSTVVASSGTSSTDTGNTVTVTVTVRDAYDNTIQGSHVVLNQGATSSSISPAPVTGANTGSGGVATFTLSDTTAESAVYSATASGTSVDQTAGVTFQPGAPAQLAFGQQPANAFAAATITPAVTVRILDAHGNLTSSTASVTAGIKPGSGSAGATLSGTTTRGASAGVATFDDLSIAKSGNSYRLSASGTSLAGADSSTFDIAPGAANAAHSTVTRVPPSVTADGSSAATITVQARDVNDNALTSGGATVALGTDRGSLSVVSDNGNGTYVATLTSLTSGSANVSGTLNGGALANTVSVAFAAGTTPNAGQSVISASPVSLAAGSPSTITVQAKDVNGNSLAAGGATVALSTDHGALSAVSDNGDGTYSATLNATAVGTAHVTGTLNGGAISGSATVTFVPGVIDALQSSVVATSATTSTDTGSIDTVTVTVVDANHNPISGANVTLAANTGSSLVSPALGGLTDANGQIVFTASDGVAESVVYSATAGGTLLVPTASVQFLPGAPTQLVFAQQPTTAAAGSTVTPSVTARILDVHGNLTTSTANVTAAIKSGTGASGATLAGTATRAAAVGVATFDDLSIAKAGTGYRLTVTSGSLSNADSATFDINPATASAAHSTITTSPSTINADGTSGTSSITVHAKDTYDNTLSTGGATVTLATTRGSLSAVTDNGDGTYSAALTATGASGNAHITGQLNGSAIGHPADVTLTPPVPVVTIDSGTPPAQTTVTGTTFAFHSPNDDGNTTFECKLDGGAFTACASPKSYTGLADGPHIFKIHGVNAIGAGLDVTASWTVDTTGPTVSFTTAPAAFTNNVTEPLAAGATDATTSVASVDFLFAPTAGACPTGTLINSDASAPFTATWTTPADGTYVVCAVAHDVLGNASATPATTSVTVDQTAPMGTLVSPAANVRQTIALHATGVTDATAGIASVSFERSPHSAATWSPAAAGIAQGGNAYDGSFDTASVGDGLYDFRVTVTDAAGNTTQQLVGPVRVDNTAPSPVALDPLAANVRQTIALSSSAADVGSGVAGQTYEISPHGAGTWTPVPASFDTTTKADGDYDLREVATDNAGNVGYSAARQVKIDNTAPVATLGAAPAYIRANLTLSSTTSDTGGSGLATVRLEISAHGAGSWSTIVSPLDTTTKSDGSYDVRVVAIDNAGNETDSPTQQVVIDNTAPTQADLDAPVAGAVLPHGAATPLSSTVADATSGIATIHYRVAGAGSVTNANCSDSVGTQISSPFDTSTVPDGHYDMWIAAIDRAGNGRCSVLPHDIVVDNTAPATTDDAPFGARNTDVTVTLSATDSVSGVATTEYRVDGGGWTTGSTVTVGAPASHANDGMHTIDYRSTDAAGNVEATKTTHVVIDTTGPSGSAADPANILNGTVQLNASPTEPDIASVQWLYRPAGSAAAYTAIGSDTTAPWELPWITNALLDGDYDLEVIFTDTTGNTTTQALSTKTVDNTAPDSAAVTSPSANAVLAGTVALTSTSHDATSGIDPARTQFQVKATGDSSFAAVSGTGWDSTAKPDGPAEVQVAVWDRAGNGPFTSAPVAFTVDNTAPAVTLTVPADVSGTTNLTATGSADIATVQFEASPHGAGTWTSIGSASGPFTTTWSTGALADGLYDVRATATDHGGHTGTDVKTIRIDNTSPTGALTAPAAGATVGGASIPVAANASDTAGSGVATVKFQYRLAGSAGAFTDISTDASAPFTAVWDASSLASGDYDLRAVVTDAAGNAFTTPSRTVTVDSTPPPVSALNVGSLLSGTEVVRVTTTSDATLAAYEVSPSGAGTWTQVATSTTGPSFDGNFDTTTVADGMYDVRAKVSDQFGNATTIVVNNVRVDNTVPAVVTANPVDGSVVASLSMITLDASEDLSAVTSLELDGVAAGFVPAISGANVSFPVGSLAPGNHALTGRIVDLAGLSAPFRVNVTIPMTNGDVAPTSKNISTTVPTTLSSTDGSATVDVPANVWQQAVPVAQDFLVLHVDPTPAASPITGNLQFASMVLNVRMMWNLAGWEEHHFDAPLEIVLTDSTGGYGYPVTYETSAWRDIPQMATAGVLPASWQDGYWRDHGAVHILTRHLSLFALVNSLSTMQLAPPRDFSGVVGSDGLTLRWAPGMDQVASYLLYVDGASTRTFGATESEGKLGRLSADMDRHYTLSETNVAGRESGQTQALRVVPPVTGLTVSEATTALATRSFVLGKTIPTYAPQVPPGTVVGPTNVQVLLEGSAVDLQVATQSIVRSAFAFSAAHAPRVRASRNALVGRVLVTGRARIDVTLDARPYVRLHRWHFYNVKAGATMLRLPFGRGLAPGVYNLYWKATSAADHSVHRLVTPLVILGPHARAHTAKPPQVVIVGNSLRSTQAVMPRLGLHVERVTGEQTFLYAAYHDVSVIVVDGDVQGLPYVRTLRTVFPSTTIVVRSANARRRAALSKLGATAVPASMSPARFAALVQRLARRG